MIRLRFLQLSDLHFGAEPCSSRLQLSPEKLQQRKQEFQALLRTLPAKIEEHQVDAVLLPGDLWDHEQLSSQQLDSFRLLYDTLCGLPVPVVIAPGNHDYYSPSSFYHPKALEAYGFASWPEHVVIFSEPSFESRWLPGWENKVRLTGRAFQDNTLLHPNRPIETERLLNHLHPVAQGDVLEILLFHGSHDGHDRFKDKLTAPFTREELLRLNFDYAAIGHYHRYETFIDDSGIIRGAYSGSPFARGLDETGSRYILIGEIEKPSQSPSMVRIEKTCSDSRQIRKQTLTVSGHDSFESLQSQVVTELLALCQPEDMILCELQGEIPPGVQCNWNKLIEILNHEFFHTHLVTDQVVPAYDVTRLKQDTKSLEGRFIQAIESQFAGATEEERDLLEKALYLGLDSLTGREVRSP